MFFTDSRSGLIPNASVYRNAGCYTPAVRLSARDSSVLLTH